MKSVMAKKSLLIRRCKRKGKDIRVRDILDDDERAKIVRLNEGYYIFKDIRNSPAYLAKKKKRGICNDMSTEDSSIIYITISC